MSARRNTFTPGHPIVITFLMFAVIGFLWMASEFLKPLALAILLSFALSPLTGFLERRGLPRAMAVVLTILLALGVLGGITYKVGEQLTMLANDTKDLRKYSEHIKAKLTWLKPQQENALDRLTRVGRDVAETLEEPATQDGVQPVKIVSQPTFTQRLQAAVGPYLERFGVVSFVLILVLFMLNNRDDLSDRIIRLFGQRPRELDDPDNGRGRATDQSLPGDVQPGQLQLRTDHRAGTVDDRRPLCGALGGPVRLASLHSLRRPRGGLRPASALLVRLLRRLARAAPGRRAVRDPGGPGQQLPGAGHLRPDDGGLGPRPAGGRHVLDLALGRARPAPFHAVDRLPRGAGQIRSRSGLLRSPARRGGPAGARRPLLSTASGHGPGRRHGDRRDGPQAAAT